MAVEQTVSSVPVYLYQTSGANKFEVVGTLKY